MKKLLLLIVGFVAFAVTVKAQPSINVSIASATFVDDDPYSLQQSWATPGGQTDDAMGFFNSASGFLVKGGVAWEVSDIFSAGLAMQLLNASSPDNFRKADMVSLGAQFRVNFTSSQKQLVPFFQGTIYFSNSQFYTQDAATKGSQTQPAFTASGNTSFGFNTELGLEYKLTKSMGLQALAGFNAFQPIDEVPAGVDYSPYATPKHFGGGFHISLGLGIKYYFGRGSKKRDF